MNDDDTNGNSNDNDRNISDSCDGWWWNDIGSGGDADGGCNGNVLVVSMLMVVT